LSADDERLRTPITQLTQSDRLRLIESFDEWALLEWPPLVRRVLSALHLSDDAKFELCWESYNLMSEECRQKCYTVLTVPGIVPVVFDNKPAIAIGKMITQVVGSFHPFGQLAGWLIARYARPHIMRTAGPIMGNVAHLPHDSDRDLDARAWRIALSVVPTRLMEIGIKMSLSSVADIVGDGAVSILSFSEMAAAFGEISEPFEDHDLSERRKDDEGEVPSAFTSF
jgi:hypothetical protein